MKLGLHRARKSYRRGAKKFQFIDHSDKDREWYLHADSHEQVDAWLKGFPFPDHDIEIKEITEDSPR